MGPDLEFEQALGYPVSKIAGVDEVGRGCLAGPVVAAAVILPIGTSPDEQTWIREINDSKKLTKEARERLSPLIVGWARCTAIGVASSKEVDELNIFHASHLAMKRAIDALKVQPDSVLVDGNFIPPQIGAPCHALVKGDSKSLSIACASIIAKVWRDQYMCMLAEAFPEYGFETHKGYPTPLHLKSLKAQGVTPYHRISFAPVFAQISKSANRTV